jgi:hypothetical protein
MARIKASLCGLLVYVSLCGASVPLGAAEPVGVDAPTRADIEDVATSDSTQPVPMGEMSQKEKERRREVCANEYDACYDQCNRFYANKKGWSKLGPCIGECKEKMAECMKKIPS